MGIREQLEIINGTLQDGVTLIAVSKTKPVEAILEAYGAGQRHFGENKIQEMVLKMEELPGDIRWHFIGNLERNKVKYLDDRVYLVHSLDRESLAMELNKNAMKKGYVQNVLLEVNIGREDNKGGCLIEDLPALVACVRCLPALHVKGLMAVIPDTQDPKAQAQYFTAMKELFDRYRQTEDEGFEMKILSMGMSGDYKTAMACGSTMVRIGSSIFGAREYPAPAAANGSGDKNA